MILTLKRTGGFAGLQETLGTVDISALGEAAQDAVATHLKALEQAISSPSPGADRLHYEVEILEPGKAARTFVIVDEGEPDHPAHLALQDLARTLGLSVP
jgi:hypothetical protein